MPQALQDRVEAWIANDPDPACREELRALLDGGCVEQLTDRFASELHFGTAGLRGAVGAGPSRMNRATVRRATVGLARYLLDTVQNCAAAGVVVGHDARHGSAAFADEAASVLSGAGIDTLRLPGQLPTPVLAFAVPHLRCAGGVMITASHNPPEDNGYKFYLGDGAQIAPPVDAQIEAFIEQVGPLSDVPLGAPGKPLGDGVLDAYLRAITGGLSDRPTARPADLGTPLKVVYTPLHGVGRDVLLAAFWAAGLPDPHVVPAQAEPDPDFPTVERPNPEEPGTLDLALRQAREDGADLLLANDPDADRLAIAVPARNAPAGRWRVLTGDEIGALLGEHLISRCADPEHALVVSTVASSTLLARIAGAAGVSYIETLTGFKWMMRAASQAPPEQRLLFAYEEALGFAVNQAVRDKDGISAALVMTRLAAAARGDGATIEDRLDDLARRFGLHATRQLSLELPGTHGHGRIQGIMRALHERPPIRLVDRTVTVVDDFAAGVRRRPGDAHEQTLAQPRADVLVLHCEKGTRVVVRPSGTEPKLKVYLQVVIDVGGGGPEQARRQAATELDEIADELQSVLAALDCDSG